MDTERNLNLENLLTGNLSRLRFIIRFSNCPRLHNESVAEHSFYTAFYAYALANAVGHPASTVVSRALMHDTDECFSGDFIRMFKHHNEEVNSAINNTCSLLMKGMSEELSENENVQREFFDDWSMAKDGTTGRIVSFADYLSVLSYIAQELSLGNVYMRRQLPELRKFHETFKKEEYTFLRVYVEDARILLDKLERGAYETTGV